MMEPIRVPPVVSPPLQAVVRPVASPSTTVVAVVVGGWLKDQTARTLQPALRSMGIRTISPPGLDDWRAPIAAMARDAVRDAASRGPVALALFGHSFGAQTVGDASHELARDGIFPALVVLIDPVSPRLGIPQPIRLSTEFRTRGGMLRVYYRLFPLGPIRANIVDERGAKIATLHRGSRRIGWGHNTMCHKRALIAEWTGLVGGLRG